MDVSGKLFPVSHFETTLSETFNFFASCCCVSPSSLRLFEMISFIGFQSSRFFIGSYYIRTAAVCKFDRRGAPSTIWRNSYPIYGKGGIGETRRRGGTNADSPQVYPESAENVPKREKSCKHRRRILEIENGRYRKGFLPYPYFAGIKMCFTIKNPRPEKARTIETG